jgi:cytochrome P450
MDDLDQLIEQGVGAERDPYPAFARKRKDTPILAEAGFGGGPVYTVYKYKDVGEVLRAQPDHFLSRVYAPAIGMVFGPSILQMDGAEHHHHRALIGGAFRRKAVADWERTLIEPTIHSLIDAFAARGRAELVRDMTIRYPIRVMAGLLGIPEADEALFTRFSLQIISLASNIRAGLDASKQLGDYYRTYIEERRRAPKDDLISTLVHASIDGERLPEEELLGFLRLLLSAGAETTYRLFGTLLFALLSNPEQLEAVRADRALLPRAIAEALRWEAPVQSISREALGGFAVAGVEIPAGAHVALSLGSANHDEEVFDDADRFDLFREGAPHLSFAEGPHRCLGEHLAIVETTVGMNAVLDRLPELRLDAGDSDPHIQGVAFRSPTRVPVAFTPS